MRTYHRALSAPFSAIVGLAFALGASPASASNLFLPILSGKNFPAAQCTTCHNNPSGGIGTATQPFGASMKNDYGVSAGDTASLEDALTKTEGDNTDSDKDGTSDIEELKAGTDPNVAGASVAPAKYGCFEQNGTVAGAGLGSPRLASLAMAALVGVSLFLRRRRR